MGAKTKVLGLGFRLYFCSGYENVIYLQFASDSHLWNTMLAPFVIGM